jgi:hypothetical protein
MFKNLGAALRTGSDAVAEIGLPVDREAAKNSAMPCRSAAEALIRRIACDDAVGQRQGLALDV